MATARCSTATDGTPPDGEEHRQDEVLRCSDARRSPVEGAPVLDAAHIIEALADEAGDVADAYVTLCVHAGIAAADVICCARLGQHSRGDDHASAVELLDRANPDAAKHLRTLLGLKNKAGYTAIPVSGSDHTRAGRAAHALVESAERV